MKVRLTIRTHPFSSASELDVWLERSDINTHKNYVAEQSDWGYVPQCPLDIMAIINKKAARYLNK